MLTLYVIFAQKSFHESDYSMQKEQTQDSFASNQNLQSVTSSLSTEPKKPTAVVYANPSKTELLKLYSKKHHFKRHCEDEDCEMACHKVTYRTLTRPFKYGPTVLTRNKLFGIIYLGLLIIKDKIQLGDLLRFIREGHLSYNNVEHLFPEETETEKFDVGTYNSRTMFLTHFGLRTTAASLAVWLEVIDHIHVQNLVALCERYCKELELPVQVAQCAVKLMSRAPPSMKFTKTTKAVPNYEARAISFVIFAMKLLFGLDDVTEHEFSRYAETINKKAAGLDFAVPRMFVWDEWIKFIQYRKLVVKEHHFPTNFLYDKTVQNPDLLITFLTEQKEKYNLNKTTSVTYDVLRQLLLKLNPQPPKKITFPISLTPFHDYVDAITFHNENLLPIIQQKFGNTSLDFLLRPYHYLKFANNNANVKVVHHGKNNKLVFEDIRNYQLEQWRERKRLKDERVVKISTDFEDLLEQIEEKPLVIETNNNAKDHEGIVQSHKKWNKDLHAVNIVKTRKVSDGTLLDDFEQVASLQCENPYSVHYNPHERYWFRSQDVTRVKKVEFDEFFEKFPYSFSLLFQECARIVEQSEKDLFLEFNNVELYLSYVANYSAAKHDRMYTVVDREIRKLINQAKTQW